jgi:hypothetical protein
MHSYGLRFHSFGSAFLLLAEWAKAILRAAMGFALPQRRFGENRLTWLSADDSYPCYFS